MGAQVEAGAIKAQLQRDAANIRLQQTRGVSNDADAEDEAYTLDLQRVRSQHQATLTELEEELTHTLDYNETLQRRAEASARQAGSRKGGATLEDLQQALESQRRLARDLSERCRRFEVDAGELPGDGWKVARQNGDVTNGNDPAGVRLLQGELVELRQKYLGLGRRCSALEELLLVARTDDLQACGGSQAGGLAVNAVATRSTHSSDLGSDHWQAVLAQHFEAVAQEEEIIQRLRKELAAAESRASHVRDEEARLASAARQDRLVIEELRTQLRHADARNESLEAKLRSLR